MKLTFISKKACPSEKGGAVATQLVVFWCRAILSKCQPSSVSSQIKLAAAARGGAEH